MREKPNNIISLNNVSLNYSLTDKRSLSVLQGVDLGVEKGKFVSIMGPSGSGKTSLLMLIAGVEPISSGELIVAGKDLSSMNEDGLAAYRQEHVGIVFQNFHLIPTMTAQENVAIALEFSGFDDAQDRAAEWLKKVGLDQRLKHYPEQLSGGEQQRVALARAFATEPDLLLADEPTGNLDSENGQIITDLLFSLKETHGTTLLLITHDAELASMAERRLHLQNGKLNDA